MANATGPVSINGYKTLKVSLPEVPSYVQPAFHYLYLCQHEPRVPSPEGERTLLVVNIPVDATEAHLRHLFSKLGGGRVEEVISQGTKAVTRPPVTPTIPPNSKGKKKRKRDLEEAIDENAKLPEVWDRVLHPSGSTALVRFVDKVGMHATLKAVAKGSRGTAQWGDDTAGKFPPLGSQRMHFRLIQGLRARVCS